MSRQAVRDQVVSDSRDLLPKSYRVREATLTCSCTRNLTNISENFLGWSCPGPSPAVNVPLWGKGGESAVDPSFPCLETCTTLLNQRYISSIYQSQFNFYSGICHPSFVVILSLLLSLLFLSTDVTKFHLRHRVLKWAQFVFRNIWIDFRSLTDWLVRRR